METIESIRELYNFIQKISFLPLFSNSVPGFSVEDHTRASAWWTGDPETDPWVWRQILASDQNIAYGKFFDKKAGFISRKWFPELQEMTGLDDDGFVKMLEEEFGHKLKYGGEKLDGNLRLSDYEVVEFSAVDEIAELTEPYLYFLRNPVAVYEGVQFAVMNHYYALLRVIPFMILFYVADSIWHFSTEYLSERDAGTGSFHL